MSWNVVEVVSFFIVLIFKELAAAGWVIGLVGELVGGALIVVVFVVVSVMAP